MAGRIRGAQTLPATQTTSCTHIRHHQHTNKQQNAPNANACEYLLHVHGFGFVVPGDFLVEAVERFLNVFDLLFVLLLLLGGQATFFNLRLLELLVLEQQRAVFRQLGARHRHGTRALAALEYVRMHTQQSAIRT